MPESTRVSIITIQSCKALCWEQKFQTRCRGTSSSNLLDNIIKMVTVIMTTRMVSSVIGAE